MLLLVEEKENQTTNNNKEKHIFKKNTLVMGEQRCKGKLFWDNFLKAYVFKSSEQRTSEKQSL